MAQSKIFEFAILLHPTQEESEKGVVSTLVKPPTVLVATSDREAAIRAAREVPPELISKMDRVEVAVRPF